MPVLNMFNENNCFLKYLVQHKKKSDEKSERYHRRVAECEASDAERDAERAAKRATGMTQDTDDSVTEGGSAAPEGDTAKSHADHDPLRTPTSFSAANSEEKEEGHGEYDKKLHRLIRIYDDALVEFTKLDKSDTKAKAEAARFLRDTAENVMDYIKSPGVVYHSLEYLKGELEYTIKMAKDAAVEFCGGRKRRFEIDDREETEPSKSRTRGEDTRNHGTQRRVGKPEIPRRKVDRYRPVY